MAVEFRVSKDIEGSTSSEEVGWNRIECQKGDKERLGNYLLKNKYILNEYRGGEWKVLAYLTLIVMWMVDIEIKGETWERNLFCTSLSTSFAEQSCQIRIPK